MNNNFCKTILLVEDEAVIAISQKVSLEKYGYKVITAGTGEKAIEVFHQIPGIELILMDIDLGKGIDGPQTAIKILNERNIPVVFLSSHTEPGVVEKTEMISSYGYVVKNSGITVLDASIKMAFKLFDAKEKLNANSARNDAIVKAIPDHMFVLDKKGTYLEVYTSNDKLLPIPSSEIIGKKLTELFVKENAEKLLGLVHQCLESSDLQVCEVELSLKGETSLYETRMTKLSKDNVIVFVRNITERKNADEALRLSEERYRLIFENSPIGLLSFNDQGIIEACNDNFVKVIGSSREVLVGLNMLKLHDENLVSSVREALNGRIGFYEGLYHSVSADKSTHVRVLFAPMDIGDGKFSGGAGIIEDITGRKQAEDDIRIKNEKLEVFNEELNAAIEEIQAANEELETANEELVQSQKELIEYGKALNESEKRYRTLVENTGQPIIVAQNGFIIYANTITSALSGYSPEELYSMPFLDFVHEDDRYMVIENYRKRLSGDSGSGSIYRFRAVSKEGDVRWLEIHAVMIEWNTGPATLNFLTDFSEQMRVENALRESEKKFRKIFENVQDIFYQTDKFGVIIEISPSIERYTGFTREELIGKPVEMVYSDPGDRMELLKIISEHGEVIDYELRLKARDNRLIVTSVSSHILFDSDGKPAGVEGSLRDITERKNFEEALKKSEELHRLLTDNAEDVIWTMDLTGRFTYVSPSVEKLRGYTVAEVMQQSIMDSLTPESAERVLPVFKSGMDAVRAGKPIPEFRGELEQPCKNGLTVWIEATISVIRNTSGEVIGIVGVSRDISDRKAVEKALRDSEELYRSILKASPDAIIISDLDGRFLMVTPSAVSMFGFEHEDEILGRMNTDFIIPEDRERAITNTSLRFSGKMKGLGEYRGIRKDGSLFEMGVNGEFIRDQNGNPTKIVFIVRDISDRKMAEDKIKSLLTEKEIILKEVHHRIKNYMNTIKGLLYLQSGTTDEPLVVTALNDAGSRVQSMMVLYDKLYQSEDYTNISMPVYLPSLIDEIISNFPNCGSVKIDKQIDDFVLNTGKLQCLGIIINELLTNIMKYAFTGREFGLITISALKRDSIIMILIKDNGVGIPDSITFKNPAGFGMQLVSMLVDQIDGSIQIERGAGTKFILEFKI